MSYEPPTPPANLPTEIVNTLDESDPEQLRDVAKYAEAVAEHKKRETRLKESFGNKFRDTGFADPARAGDDGCVGRLPVRDRFENAREVVHLGVAMLDFSGNKPGAEDASIADHLAMDTYSPGKL